MEDLNSYAKKKTLSVGFALFWQNGNSRDWLHKTDEMYYQDLESPFCEAVKSFAKIVAHEEVQPVLFNMLVLQINGLESSEDCLDAIVVFWVFCVTSHFPPLKAIWQLWQNYYC